MSWKSPEVVAFDIETNGLNPYRGSRAFTFAICDLEGHTEVVDDPRLIQNVLYSSREIICQNYHFEYSILKEQGFIIPENIVWHDTMIIHQLLFNLAWSHGLDDIALDLCTDRVLRAHWEEGDLAVSKAFKIYKSYDKIPRDLMHKYQVNDVVRTMLIFQTLYPRIVNNSQLLQCYRDEIDVVKVTNKFEAHGIMIAHNECDKLITWCEDELVRVTADTYSVLKQHINMNSPDQVSDLLFNQLGLPPVKLTDRGKNSIDNDVLAVMLEQYSHDAKVSKILDLVLRMRSYTRGCSTIKSYIKHANENDILHPHINTNRAGTGRESSSDPNLQNVSKEASLLTKYPIPARRCFRARPGTLLYTVDEKSIELRLIIEHTQEPELVELVEKNGDPHDVAAQCFYGDRYIKETDKKKKKELRGAAKNMHFALAYGAKLPKIANGLGLSIEETKPGYEAYCKRFPLVAGFTKKMIALASNIGYVKTSFGRNLQIPHDNKKSASNYIIQGTAAGIIKRAQIQVDKVLDRYEDAHLLLPIHDELIFELPRKLFAKEKEFLHDVSDAMTNISEIKVPLAVEVKRSTLLWSQAKEIQI